MNNLYPLFIEHIAQYQLIHNGDTVILGFSGGKDSVTLFLLLKELQKRKDIDFRFVAAYFNHNLRSDAIHEQQWVRDFCNSQKAELVIGSKKVMEFKSRNKLNLEQAASISRYQFFQHVSARYANAKVATAHTKSDLTETFFIKLFRGSGLQGLSTIFHKKQNTIIRPLLLFDESQIREFLERNKISFYSDYTNEGDEFLRNRIRHHVVPEVLKIEPEIHHRVFKTVNIIQAEYDYFSQRAVDILDKSLIFGNVLPTAILKAHHLALQRHIVREYIRLLKGDLLNIDFRHIEEVRILHAETRGVAIPGLELTFHKQYIFPKAFTFSEYSYLIEEPETNKSAVNLNIEETGCQITIKKKSSYKKPPTNFSILLPYSSLTFPLTLRNPRRGDKYVKINTSIDQRVFEMIRSAGLPSSLRNLYPCLINGDNEIIWSVGSPVADKFKCIDKSDKYLSFIFQQ